MTELEQKLLAENEQLHRELDELKQKLEVETSPRVEYVDEKTRRFRDMLYRKHESTGYYMKTISLHVDVYVRAGRVMIADDENNVRYSGVGDETNWVEDTNDDSSAKFLEVGYKDGGKLFGMINLSSDVLLVKDNRRLYRLNGEYPNWSLNEVSRNVEVRSRLGMCAIADSVFVLGRNEVQSIQTTNAYGDMKPADMSPLIAREIQSLPANTMLRYLPSLNQIWAIAGADVMVFDLRVQNWYKRQFNSPLVDAIPVGEEVLIIKADRVSKLDDWSFYDAGLPMRWYWQARRLLSQNEFFLKKTQISFTPMDRKLSTGKIRAGDVAIELPAIESRNVYRNKFLDLVGSGSGGGMTFNEIIMTVAEV